jgi:8-oxo-dGTP pyrophosphatase MutT (NUDIX family)
MDKQELIKLLVNYNTSYKEEEEYKKQMLEYLHSNEVFLGKGNKQGHITGSSWIVSTDRKKVLLTYHRKLNKWLQLGGHTEEGEDILEAALREAKEESGLLNIRAVSKEIFDLDVHMIPARKDEKEHFHYDIRFIFEADDEDSLQISSESKDLKWVPLEQVINYSATRSILRMVEKTKK